MVEEGGNANNQENDVSLAAKSYKDSNANQMGGS